MNLNKLCPGKARSIWQDARYEQYEGPTPNPFRASGVKRIRMVCELCGRRVKSSVHTDSDGDYLIHTIPPHKPKGWWKKHARKV